MEGTDITIFAEVDGVIGEYYLHVHGDDCYHTCTMSDCYVTEEWECDYCLATGFTECGMPITWHDCIQGSDCGDWPYGYCQTCNTNYTRNSWDYPLSCTKRTTCPICFGIGYEYTDTKVCGYSNGQKVCTRSNGWSEDLYPDVPVQPGNPVTP